VGLVRDPALVGYVSEIGRRLAAHTSTLDAPYQFHVADDTEPNAFALPGGFVYVTRGLLALSNSEDELAGVIGHEIGHVAARHSVRQIEASTPSRSLRCPSAIVGIVSPALAESWAASASSRAGSCWRPTAATRSGRRIKSVSSSPRGRLGSGRAAVDAAHARA